MIVKVAGHAHIHYPITLTAYCISSIKCPGVYRAYIVIPGIY